VRFVANESTVPRLHLIGSLSIVFFLTLALGAFFSWRSVVNYRASFARVEQAITEQQKARLTAEMDSALSYIEFTHSRTEDVLRSSLAGQVDTAMQIVEAIYARESPHRPADEVKRLIAEALRPVRFYDGRGYYFIDDMKGQFILLPTAPQLEGKTVLDNRDDRGHYIMRGLIEAARKPRGEGFSRYRWYTPGNTKEMADKLAYVRHFAPYDWLIGTGDYTYQWEPLQKAQAIARLRGLRFGESGYIGLIDREGHSLLSPSNLKLEGQHFTAMPPADGASVEKLFQHARQGGGFIHYEWTDPVSGEKYLKTALVRVAEPWGWILVATIKDDELKAALKTELAQHESGAERGIGSLLLALAAALTVGLTASYLFSLWSRKLFKRYHDENEAHRRALLESQALYRLIADNSNDVIWLMALPAQTMSYVSPSIERLCGWTAEEALAQPMDVALLPESASRVVAVLKDRFERLAAGDDSARFITIEVEQPCKDGRIIATEMVCSILLNAAGKPKQVLGTTRDITVRKQAETSLHLAASVFTHAREGIMITDADGSIIDVNDAFSRITGYSRDEVLGQNPRILSSGRQSKEYYSAMWVGLKDKGYWYGEVWNSRKNDEVYVAMQTISAVRDPQGRIQQYVALFSDITALKEHENQLEHIAHYDALTNLPNRVLLADRLRQGMVLAQRHRQPLAVAFLDLDGFKAINDTYGHEAGDQLLIAVGTRMKQALREGDTLARLGGDEFVVVLLDLTDVEASKPMLTRLLAAAAQPLPFGDAVLQVSASLGVTFYPQTQDVDADQLLRQADQAMYQAKLSGKNRYHVFDAEQDSSVRGHHESVERISRALHEREFVLYYQPKVNMRTGKVIGAEALIRWQHPEQGLLPPATFLPVIEDHPLAVDIGEWVIDTALTQIEHWQAQGLDMPVSVNVGARQLQQTNFVARLRDILARHPAVKPASLELEVLETSALEDVGGVSESIEACRQMGVLFALDDFGTGYSSLTYLKRLQVSLLKIDQSFVRDMLDDPDDLAILEGVIGLANTFHRQVIAEGVETVAHGAMLLQLGCELAQGYGIARPMPAAQLPDWAATWQPDPAWGATPLLTRIDLPLLFGGVEHRAWTKVIESYIKGERDTPPMLDFHQCRLGMWLDAEARSSRCTQPGFLAIQALHRDVHELASELCTLRAQGQMAQALDRLEELMDLQVALLAQLKLQEGRL
jgi:diguanylate cyclase (GGDEF)-like protein/PAS domain S-box-containing protein